MTWKHRILALASLALVSSGLLGAGEQGATTPLQIQTDQTGEYILFPQRSPGSLEDSPYLVRGQSGFRQEVAVRFGWWGISTQGNQNKIGEWQGLESSAFWDVDAITSDGYKTVDFTLTGTEDEGLDTHWRYFSPGLSAEVDFSRFLHRLDHDSLANFVNTDGTSYTGSHTDVNPGDEYAIRVQKFDANFKGHLTENVKWRLNLWGMRKFGERGTQAFAHRFGPNGDGTGGCGVASCHIVNQRQTINWLTMEIEPVIEAKLGPVTVEYSRTMRSFNQADGIVTRQYGADRHSRAIRPRSPGGTPYDYPYAMASENFTQIDRFKLGADLTENTDFYANVFFGNTENKGTGANRDFDGFDLRATNRTFDRLTVSGFVKRYAERNQGLSLQTRTDILQLDDLQGWTLDDDFDGSVDPYNTRATILDDFRIPANRTTISAGAKARWKPFPSLRGFSLNGGYEYRTIQRSNVTYALTHAAGADPLAGHAPFTQPNTISNMMHVGMSTRLSRSADSFVRYKIRRHNSPLFGFNESVDGPTLGDALNTKLPEEEDLLEFGGTWTPSYNFMLSGTFGFQNRQHSSVYANFDETDYPIMVTAWYAPTARWSVSGGLGFFSNWINQDITIGRGQGATDPAESIRFNYGGRADVINVGSSYAATDCLTFSGDMEFVRAVNGYADPSTANLSVPGLPALSDVLTETTRFSTGVDYRLRQGISCYFRYQFYDWNDEAGNNESGTAHMFLSGVTATY